MWPRPASLGVLSWSVHAIPARWRWPTPRAEVSGVLASRQSASECHRRWSPSLCTATLARSAWSSWCHWVSLASFSPSSSRRHSPSLSTSFPRSNREQRVIVVSRSHSECVIDRIRAAKPRAFAECEMRAPLPQEPQKQRLGRRWKNICIPRVL